MKSVCLFQKAFSRHSWRSFPCEWIFNTTVSIELCRLSIKCLTLAEYNYSLYYNTAKKLPNGYPRPPLPLPPFYHSVGTGMDLIVRYLFLAVTRGVIIQNPKKIYPPPFNHRVVFVVHPPGSTFVLPVPYPLGSQWVA